MKLTALQQVMMDIEEHYPKMFDIYTQEGRDFISRFRKYIEIEKQQIIDAYNSGQQIPPFDYAENYYLETYKNQTHEKVQNNDR